MHCSSLKHIFCYNNSRISKIGPGPVKICLQSQLTEDAVCFKVTMLFLLLHKLFCVRFIFNVCMISCFVFCMVCTISSLAEE